ncbi:hypothetical protein, partial [Alteromonas abrolhosensis]|uniref:hypothetical protein n=1 Tax=Alteromonas abrolhosensis TaxID=1892904 RepID=UPI003BABD596
MHFACLRLLLLPAAVSLIVAARVEDTKIQKLDFDSDNIRYLIRIPSPGEKLTQKKILFSFRYL